MKKIFMSVISIIIISLIGIPSLAMGQERLAGKWWRIPKVSKELHLKEEEKDRLDDLFVENRRKLIDLRGNLEKARLDLDAILGKKPLNREAVWACYDRLEKARENLARERFQFLLKVREILGPERFERLKMMYRGLMTQKRHRVMEGGMRKWW